MNLTIDIGNTNVMICIFKNNRIIKHEKLNVRNFSKTDQYNFFKKLFVKYKILNILISSVVPKIAESFFEIFKKLKVDYLQIQNLLKICKLKTNIRNKSSIGDDRLINIIYAKHLFVRSKVIIDFGTATTIDVLDKKGVYDGGVITPGIDLSLKSLQMGTAKLPLVNFKKTKSIVGKSTKEAIQSGFFWGYVSMIQGLIHRIQLEKKTEFQIILTGGNSKYFKGCFENVINIDEYFNSKGLNYLTNTYFRKS